MNEDKVIEVLIRIEEEKDMFALGHEAVGFNMNVWYAEGDQSEDTNMCGTVACLAGHAAIMDGWHMSPNSDMCRNDGGDWMDVEDVGSMVLGINTADGNPFYLSDLDSVYRWFAEKMGVDEQVLRDKVTAGRTR